MLKAAYDEGGTFPELHWVPDALLRAYEDAGLVEGATKFASKWIADTRASQTSSEVNLAQALASCGEALVKLKAWDTAEPLLRELLSLKETQRDKWILNTVKRLLGTALANQRKFAEAEPLLIEAHDWMRENLTAIPGNAAGDELLASVRQLIDLYEGSGRASEADQWRIRLSELSRP